MWDWGLTAWGEVDELEQANNLCQGTTCREHRYPPGNAWGVLSRKQGGAQQGPALSEHWLLSLLAALSAPGLLSVTSLSVTAGGSRKWEPLCLVPAGAQSFGSGGVSGLQLLCLWLGRPESVSDGVSAEQPLSPSGLGSARTHQQLPQLPELSGFGRAFLCC